MSSRREARRALPFAASNGLPPELAMGPCIEVWADREGGTPGSPPWMRARRAWNSAVDEWAAETGWASEGRPASNARNLARTRHHWSRKTLAEAGERNWLDYLEGAGSQPAGEPPWFRFRAPPQRQEMAE